MKTCRHCGQSITYRQIAEDGFTHEPVMRWCIAERIPGLGTYKCPDNDGQAHEPAGESMTEKLHSVRITDRVHSYLTGGSLWEAPEKVDRHGYGPEGLRLYQKVEAAPLRKDLSRTVKLDAAEIEILWEMADMLAVASADDAGPYNTDALADYNAGRALVRQIERLKEKT